MYLKKEELTKQKLFDVYKDAYMDPEMDDDGDIMVVVEGMRIHPQLSPDRPFFVLTAGFGLQPSAPRDKILEFSNRINDHMIMVRCCYPERAPRPMLWLDHWTMTEGGISTEEIIKVTRRFATVILDGFRSYDSDNLLA